MNKLILVLVLSVAILAFSQATPICSSNSDCNDYSTAEDKVCDTTATDPLSYVCKARTTFDFKTINTDTQGRCKDSLNFLSFGGNKCGQYAVVGCEISDTDRPYTDCVGSTYDPTTKKCTAPKPADPVTTYVGEGGRCDPRPTKAIQCGDNLSCLDNVCVAKLKQGDNCMAGGLACKNGLSCDGDFCAPSRSKYDGEKCKTPDVCRGGVCTEGVCLERRAIPCFSNSHCTGLGEVCYKASGSLRGTCTSSNTVLWIKYYQCQRENYQAITSKAPEFPLCEKSVVESACASACKKRVDLRTSSDAFTYNCQTMTKTAIPAGTCTVKEFFTGCPATPIAGAMVNGLSVLLFAIIALIFA